MTKWVEGRVIKHKEWTSGLYSLYVDAHIHPFTAGQFAQLSLDEDEPRLFRPYSFANSPFESPLEFYYDKISHGQFSPRLSNLKEGDIIWVGEKAHGRFILADIPSAQVLWLIGTGTGFGVFLAMLKTKEPWERFKHIILIHSVREEDSLTHAELIRCWQGSHPNQFTWFPLVTREKSAQYFSPRITALIQNGSLEDGLQHPLSPYTSQVMLCGNPIMVKEVTEILHGRGLYLNRPRQPGHITIENYWKL